MLIPTHLLPMLLTRILATVALLAVTSHTFANEPLRVMSFNVRFGSARDGENHWDHRRDFLIDVIHEADPDLLGTQEMIASQRAVIQAAMPEHACLGVGRDDGKEGGEQSALFVHKDRFDVTKWGTHWLSETPAEPGSMSWGVHYPRLFTWALLKRKDNQEPLLVVNTHWDHESELSRSNSGDIIAKWLRMKFPDVQQKIIMGDFNCGPSSEPIQKLVQQSGIVDTFTRAEEGGTFHNFTGQPTSPRIDMILVAGNWQIVSSKILRTHREGRYPSDHFPVSAELVSLE